ncbi:hypothetical protein GW17_00048028 [Ensete ventricosum]|nr:hypothetical protein GW17_00048028 [Ensete ventricosum]
MYRPYRTVRTGPPGYRYVDCSLSGGTAKIDRRRSISAIGGRLREKKGRRRRGKEERRGEERIPRVVLARASSPPAGHPRAVAVLANGDKAVDQEQSCLVRVAAVASNVSDSGERR